MMNNTKTKLLQWTFNATAVILIFLAVSSRNAPLGNLLTRGSNDYGDIYGMCRVNLFKHKMPVIRSVDDINLDELNESRIICFGDSFFDIYDLAFARILKEAVGIKTCCITRKNCREEVRKSKKNPLILMKLMPYKPKEETVLIWEIVERDLVSIMTINPHPDSPTEIQEKSREPVSPIRRIHGALRAEFLSSDKMGFRSDKFEYLLRNIYGIRWLLSHANTVRFMLFHEIFENTYPYSLNPNMLFYHGDVEIYQKSIGDEDLNRLADVIEGVGIELKERYNIKLIFLVVPDKLSVYGNLCGFGDYNNLIPRLVEKLEERGILCADLYTEFHKFRMTSDDSVLLYHPSDTHWTEKGIDITVGAIEGFITHRR